MSIRLLPGVHAPHRKNTKDMAPVRMPPPALVRIPLSMNIGRPATPLVKLMEKVQVGQKIAEAGGFVGAPIHSSVSGTVKKFDDLLLFHGGTCKVIVIEPDGEQTPWEGIAPPEVTDFDSFINAVRESGVVGLGGATFPTSVKLKVDPEKVEYICVNGAECEPYITADTRTMLDDGERLSEGFDLLHRFYPKARILVGIEDNKPKSIKHLTELNRGKDYVQVCALPALYPQGGEKVLIHNLTGRIVPAGKLPIDVGCVVINTSTLKTIAEYVATGKPLVEKYVTVDGSAIKHPMNVIAPIGASVHDVVEFTGGYSVEPGKIIMGGPMMGMSVPSDEEVVTKGTGSILALNAEDAVLPEPTDCIKCGRCVNHCPLHLSPADIETAFRLKKPEDLKVLRVDLCMECGCCAFICPACRPLVQVNKLAKQDLSKYNAKLKAEADAKAKKEAEKAEKKGESANG
ncbi:MAG: electron transport complex subunit RsxC [Oscillospiraceae bacterium]|nr:electron transport complex subunit RsxC [Oscillospiraceae bacterium]